MPKISEGLEDLYGSSEEVCQNCSISAECEAIQNEWPRVHALFVDVGEVHVEQHIANQKPCIRKMTESEIAAISQLGHEVLAIVTDAKHKIRKKFDEYDVRFIECHNIDKNGE